MWSDVSDDTVDFDEAIEQFRKLTPIADDEFDRLTARAKRKAFKVAGLAQLDLVQDTFDAIDDAVANGTSLEDFVSAVGEALESAWHGDVENPGWRLETIFRTNCQRAYGEGRYRQATDPDTLQDRPYWQFSAIIDDGTTEVCEDCDGTTLPADDPWWDDHLAPLHHGCRSTFITLTEEQAAAEGLTEKAPDSEAADGFGEPPLDDTEEDQEQADFEPDLSDYDPGLAKQFEEQQEEAPPVPEPKRAEAGTHYESVKRDKMSRAERERSDNALKALADYDLLPELEATPLREIKFQPRLNDPAIATVLDLERVDGYCTPGGDVALRLEEPHGGFTPEKFFRPGKTWRVADAAADWDACSKLTMLHETAHHLHFSGGADVDTVIRRAYSSSSGQRITKYADQDHREYWAETFSAHKVYPDKLAEHDPTGAQMVKDVLALRKKLR